MLQTPIIRYSHAFPSSPNTNTPPRKQTNNQIYANPLPVTPHPLLPPVLSQPLTLLRYISTLLAHHLSPPSSLPAAGPYVAYYDAATRGVHVPDPTTARAMWERGFFGKGSLSRSEPEWLERERRRRQLQRQMQQKGVGGDAEVGENLEGRGKGREQGQELGPRQKTAAEVTSKRREGRRNEKRERARKEAEAVEEQLRLEEETARGIVRHGQELRSGERVGDVVAVPETSQTGEVGVGVGEIIEALNDLSIVEDRVKSDPAQQQEEVLLDQEHLQLSAVEAFFLSYALGCLEIVDATTQKSFDLQQLFSNFRQDSYTPSRSSANLSPDDPFLLSYVVYHHFRSLGWVVRSGMKFAVDFLLYNRGPVFSHAEFAVLIIPSYSHEDWSASEQRRKEVAKKEKRDWWWLHCANRVQGQVRKTLVLVYVDIPSPGSPSTRSGENESIDITALLCSYRIKEVVLKRWSANRNRD